jgi:hypothetical protein
MDASEEFASEEFTAGVPADRMARSSARLQYTWVAGAGVVVLSRMFNAGGPGYDMSLQVLAAHNLLAGRGLSVYIHTGLDLTDPATLCTLTHFPAGYSLAAAALFSLGLGVGGVVKLLGAVATIAGWWGWARLAIPFLAEGMSRSSVWRWVAFLFAITTPLFFTIPWTGTDIFLWAVVPWVVLFLVRAADDGTNRASLFDLAAGLLCGFALLTRYASLFLVVYAGLVIVWQSGRRFAVLMRRWIVLGLGLLPFVAVQWWINVFLATGAARPGGLNSSRMPPLQRFLEGLSLLHTANAAWAFWLPGKAVDILFPDTAVRLPWQTLVAVCAAALLAAAAATYMRDSRVPSRDPRLVSLLLFVLIPPMLLAAMTVGVYDYVGDRRYYWPCEPLALLVAYSLAARYTARKRPMFDLVAARTAAVYLSGYIAMALVFGMLLLLPVQLGASQRAKLLGASVVEWPSSAVVYELSPARALMRRLARERPDSWLVTSRAADFLWDASVDRSRLIDMNCPMNARRITGPARLVIMTFDKGKPDDLWYFVGNGFTGSILPADCLAGLTGTRMVQRFPGEGLKVLEADVADGAVVALQ